MFAFVWLPRDELTTARRKSIAQMIEAEVGTEMTSWSVELGDGDLALIRYTQYIGDDRRCPTSTRSTRRWSRWSRLGAGVE